MLAWTHRHTVALWCRSIGTEARQQFEDRKPNLSRSKNLLKSLWRVSSDAQLANAPELRRIVVHDAGITVDAVETWPGRYLLDSRLGIDKITNGKVTNDTLKDRPIEPALSEIFGPDGRGTLTHQLEGPAQQSRHMHLRKTNQLSNFSLRTILEESQSDDLALALR